MIKTELEWHSNKDTPSPEHEWEDYLIMTLGDGYWHCEAMFDEADKFSHFMWFSNEQRIYFDLEDVTCWAKLTEFREIIECFTDDKVTDCACGDTTPHEPWEPECGLGKSEEHCRVADEGVYKHLDEFIKDYGKEEPEEDNSFIVANMAQCALCKDVIESHRRNDFVSCSCKDGIAVDGGHSYLRRLGERENIIELSVYSTDDYELIRTHFKRGSRGINGDEPLTWVPLRNMTIPHLCATIDYEKASNPNNKFIGLYEQELKCRGELENEGVFKDNEK